MTATHDKKALTDALKRVKAVVEENARDLDRFIKAVEAESADSLADSPYLCANVTDKVTSLLNTSNIVAPIRSAIQAAEALGHYSELDRLYQATQKAEVAR